MRRPTSPFRLPHPRRLPASIHAQTPAPAPHSGVEARTAPRLSVRCQSQGPLALHSFLANFPKAADLHVHLSGAVYAETFIRDAGVDGLCVNPAALKLRQAPLRSAADSGSAPLSGN